MKRFISILLMMILVVTSFASTAFVAEAEETLYVSGDYKYRFAVGTKIEIAEYKGKSEKLVIPQAIDGHTVIGIGKNAFAGNDKLLSLTIPNTVTYIDDFAFLYCSEMTSVKLPDNLEKIGKGAFSYCFSLTGINLPTTLKSIGDLAFTECSEIKTMYIPINCQEIGKGAFCLTASLTEFTVNNLNQYFVAIDGVLYNKNKTTLIAYPSKKADKSFDVPDSVKNIADYAFYGADLLESVNMFGVENIGAEAFSDCSLLAAVNLSLTLKTIGENAFVNCPKIRRIGIPDSVLSIGKHAIGYEYNERGKIYLPLGTIIIYGKEGYAGYLYAQETGLRFEKTGENDLGDINLDGKINIVDIVLLRAHIVNPNKALNDEQLNRANLNRDEKVNILDVVLLRNQIVKTIN